MSWSDLAHKLVATYVPVLRHPCGWTWGIFGIMGCRKPFWMDVYTVKKTKVKEQTWCSHFCTGSSHFLCSTRYRFPQVELGSTSTWDTCCASSCPWHRARNGLRSCLRIRHIFSRRGCQLSPGVAGHYYLGSPWSKRRERSTKQEKRDRRRKKRIIGEFSTFYQVYYISKCLDQPK